MGNAKMKSDTIITREIFENFVRSVETPLVYQEYLSDRINLYIDDAEEPTLSFIFAGGHPLIHLHGEWFNDMQWWDEPSNTLVVAYSDTFFHLWIYTGTAPVSIGTWTNRLVYTYEIIGEHRFEGHTPRNGVWYEYSAEDHIYNSPMYDVDTGAFYYHKNWMNYTGDNNTIDYSPDFLFLFDSASEFDSPDVYACSTVPRHKVIVFEGKEYFSIEENLLIPLFDPEPEPPEPEDEDEQDSDEQQ